MSEERGEIDEMKAAIEANLALRGARIGRWGDEESIRGMYAKLPATSVPPSAPAVGGETPPYQEPDEESFAYADRFMQVMTISAVRLLAAEFHAMERHRDALLKHSASRSIAQEGKQGKAFEMSDPKGEQARDVQQEGGRKRGFLSIQSSRLALRQNQLPMYRVQKF